VARTRRPMRRRSAAVLRRRPRLDWVYHDDSYSNNFVDIPSGIVGANFFTLVDSQNAMRFMRYGAVETPVAAMPMLISGEWQRPREAQLVMRAVEWYAYAAPSVWAIASVYGMGMRLMSAIQDPFTGLAGVPPAYSIWGTPAGGTGTTAAGIANVKAEGKPDGVEDGGLADTVLAREQGRTGEILQVERLNLDKVGDFESCDFHFLPRFVSSMMYPIA